MTEDELRAVYRQRKYLRPSQAAVLIRKTKRTINRWIEAGLPVVLVAGSRYVETAELLQWAADEERRTRRIRTQPDSVPPSM